MSKISRDHSMLGGVTHLRNDVYVRVSALVVVNDSTVNLHGMNSYVGHSLINQALLKANSFELYVIRSVLVPLG